MVRPLNYPELQALLAGHCTISEKSEQDSRTATAKRIRETFSNLRTDTPQLQGTERNDNVVWLEPVCCEVAYQEVTKDRKLRIPRFAAIRSDKKPGECTTDPPRVRMSPPPAGTATKKPTPAVRGTGTPPVTVQ